MAEAGSSSQGPPTALAAGLRAGPLPFQYDAKRPGKPGARRSCYPRRWEAEPALFGRDGHRLRSKAANALAQSKVVQGESRVSLVPDQEHNREEDQKNGKRR